MQSSGKQWHMWSKKLGNGSKTLSFHGPSRWRELGWVQICQSVWMCLYQHLAGCWCQPITCTPGTCMWLQEKVNQDAALLLVWMLFWGLVFAAQIWYSIFWLAQSWVNWHRDFSTQSNHTNSHIHTAMYINKLHFLIVRRRLVWLIQRH